MLGVKEFKEKFRADKVFAKKFENIKTLGDVVSLAGQEGFSFTVDDLVDALKNRELTDAELDAVASGVYDDFMGKYQSYKTPVNVPIEPAFGRVISPQSRV